MAENGRFGGCFRQPNAPPGRFNLFLGFSRQAFQGLEPPAGLPTSTEVWAKSLCAASKVSNYHNGMARVDVTPPKFVWRCVHLALYLVVAILMTIVEHRTVHVT